MPKPPPEFEVLVNRATDLPMDQAALMLEEVVERLKPLRIRHAARNAFVHLRAAWKLHPVDSEMTLIRAVTGQEEAATALILALRHRRYPGALRLNHTDHAHKAAVWAMLEAIANGFAKKGVTYPQLRIRTVGEPQLEVVVDLAKLAGLDKPLFAKPDHPFNLVMHSDENGPFEVHRWTRELSELASQSGSKDVSAYIKKEANLRNRVLYASEKGVPAIRFSDDLITRRLARTYWLIIVCIGILQTASHQLLIVQGLESLLMAIERFEGEQFAFPSFRVDGPHVSLVEQPEGKMSFEWIDE